MLSCALLFYSNSTRHTSKHMRGYCTNEEGQCRKLTLLPDFDGCPSSVVCNCQCCDVCKGTASVVIVCLCIIMTQLYINDESITCDFFKNCYVMVTPPLFHFLEI